MTRCRPIRPLVHGLSIAALLALSACAGNPLQTAADEQMAAGDYEAAVQTLERAYQQRPDSVELRTSLLQARTEAISRLITQAGAARSSGQLAQAEQLVARAQRLDPANLRTRELSQALAVERRQAQARERVEALAAKGQISDGLRTLEEALKDNPRNADLLALRRDLEQRQRQSRPPGAIALAETRPVTLDFRDANLRTVLDLVSRNSGVNFVLDRDIRSDLSITIYLRNAPVGQALDIITRSHQLMTKVLDERTVLIYPNTPEKLREHQEQVVRVFYLTSAEAKGAAAFLSAMLKLREPFVDERNNMLALRESAQTMQLAERLLNLYDTSEPEVMLDLEVLEVGSSRLTDLGIKFPDSITLTPLPLAGASGLTVAGVRNLNDERIGVSVAGLLLNLKREVGDFEILANPRVRAKSREKAKVLIGNKVPVITTTASQNGFVSDNVNYLDVGLKLDLQPTVYADDDVSIKVELEVSSLASEVRTTSGLVAYNIQTRNASTTLRLRDGETQVLAGLISREQRNTSRRLPGVGDIPVLGRLFSSDRDDGQRSELVLAITPRVLRNVRRLDASESEVWVGTESQTRGAPLGGDPFPGGMPGGRPGVEAPPPAPGELPPAPATADGPTSRLSGPGQVRVGEEFSVMLDLATPAALNGLAVELRSTEGLAELLDVMPGAMLSGDGVPAKASLSGSGAAARIELRRQQPTAIAGAGPVATLRWRALRAGRLDLSILAARGLAAPGAQAPSLTLTPGEALSVEVVP